MGTEGDKRSVAGGCVHELEKMGSSSARGKSYQMGNLSASLNLKVYLVYPPLACSQAKP